MQVFLRGGKYNENICSTFKKDEELNKHTLLLPHENSSKSNNNREFYKTIDIFIAEVTFVGTGLEI